MLGFLFRRKKVRRINFNQVVDPEFELFNGHLQRFLDFQHLALTMGKEKVEFYDGREGMRYLYFIMGAADRLSRGIEKSDRAQVWWGSVCIAQGSMLLGKLRAFEELKRYGDPSNAELYSAGQSGWEAMGGYFKFLSSKKAVEDEKDLRVIGLLMTKVVRGY